MERQLSKPARTKATYTDQYKQEALDLWRASGGSAAKVAAELGFGHRARMKADGVCETRIRSVARGSGSSRAPTAVGHAVRSQGRGTGVGRGLGTGAHLPLHDP